MRIVFVLIAMLMVAGCASSPKVGGAADPGLDVLLDWMTGDFDNTPALADPERNAVEQHFPIEVHLRPLPHMENALYIEQAAMARPEAPYRQRVYLLRRGDDGTYVSEVWMMADPTPFVNAHEKPEALAQIREEDLIHKEGCDVILNWNGEAFIGGTVGTECESTMAGASYATAEVVIHADGFSSLDRGFNASGEQVWGAEKLAYEFTRKAE